MQVAVEEIQEGLSRDGYFVRHVSLGGKDPVRFIVETARALGEVFLPPDCDPDQPVIRTEPTRGRRAAPFDRPEAIGWHGDFATYEDRPEVSLVYIVRPDPRGGNYGAWRLASVKRLLALLCETGEGRAAFQLLSEERLPFSYADGEPPRWFRVVEPGLEAGLGLRFYLPSIRRGCLTEYGEVPARIAAALEVVKQAADEVAETVPTEEGSLLIATNWFALHDRVRQTVSRTRENREALLCFVARQHRARGR